MTSTTKEPTARERILLGEVKTWPKARQALFRKSIRQGNTIAMAHMLASRETGFVRNSDSIFNASQHDLMTRGTPEYLRENMVQLAEKAGIRTHGKTYFGQLGTYDDPAAWVSGVDDAIAGLKRKGRDADGLIRVRGRREQKPVEAPRLAPDIVNRFVAKHLRENPRDRERLKRGKLKRKDLEIRMIEKHGRKVD